MKTRTKIALVAGVALFAAGAIAATPAIKQTWDFQVRANQTTANTKIANFKNAAGTAVATVDIEGDIACHDLTVSGTFTLPGTNFASGITVATNKAAIAAAGDLNIGPNKFTVAAASGNTVAAGTLAVTGNVAVNTDKFVVTAASGNTAVAGTLGVTGDVAVNTDKATIAAASGNTVLAGTLTQGAALAGGTLIASKGIMTAAVASKNVAPIASKGVGSETFTITGVAAGDLVYLRSVSGDFDLANLVTSCTVTSGNTVTCAISNNTGSSIDPASQTYNFLVIDLT